MNARHVTVKIILHLAQSSLTSSKQIQ
ncbi:unnamed protein product, partial [Rotaria sp. Silwood2]